MWDCEYTGKSGCTYAVALKSEKEAKQQIDSLPRAIQRTIVTLIHNVIRSSINGLTEELTGYLRERYQLGEVVEYSQKKYILFSCAYSITIVLICTSFEFRIKIYFIL